MIKVIIAMQLTRIECHGEIQYSKDYQHCMCHDDSPLQRSMHHDNDGDDDGDDDDNDDNDDDDDDDELTLQRLRALYVTVLRALYVTVLRAVYVTVCLAHLKKKSLNVHGACCSSVIAFHMFISVWR